MLQIQSMQQELAKLQQSAGEQATGDSSAADGTSIMQTAQDIRSL